MHDISFGYAPGYVGEINTSDLFLCGVTVNEHGVPVIGVPISNRAIKEILMFHLCYIIHIHSTICETFKMNGLFDLIDVARRQPITLNLSI